MSPAIEVRGLGRGSPLAALVRRRLARRLGRLRVSPVEARASFFDEDGPRGGVAARCALTARLPRRPAIRVEDVALTPRLAFDAALAKLERELAEHVERRRERARYPKKYYVARRLREAGAAGAASPEPRAGAPGETAG